MKIYHYSENEKEYLGSSEALESPLEKGVFLIPASATNIKPKTLLDRQANIFENNNWKIVTDLRNEKASLIDNEGLFIEQYKFKLGEEYKENIIKGLPPTDLIKSKWIVDKWVESYIKEGLTLEEKLENLENENLMQTENLVDIDFRLSNMELEV